MNQYAYNYQSPPPEAELPDWPVERLTRIREEARTLSEQYKEVEAKFTRALQRKYAAALQQKRQQEGKDSGTISVQDGGFTISEQIPKRVEWDQEILALASQQIASAGDDPAEYISVKYSVPERKWEAWPEHIRASFASARTLKFGKSKLTVTQEDAS